MPHFAYVKDRFVEAAHARISIEERGFRFADGVFETVAVYQGVPYQWEFHLKRLAEGVAALQISADIGGLQPVCAELLARNGVLDGMLRIYISRGTGSRGYLPFPLEGGDGATLVVESMPRPAEVKDAVSLWLSAYEKISPRALPVHLKTAQGLNSTLARIEAIRHGCFEALQRGADGQICEASSANIFWLKDGALRTPALAAGCLNGSTRHAVMRLSPYDVEEGVYPLAEIERADAVILTNSAYIALPVASLAPTGWSWDSAALAADLKSRVLADVQACIRQRHA